MTIEFAITAPVAKPNYESRTHEIAEFLGNRFKAAPEYIMIESFYRDLGNSGPQMMEKAAEEGRKFGEILAQYGTVKAAQVHYPWQFRPMDNRGYFFGATVAFAMAVRNIADLEKTYINHHGHVAEPFPNDDMHERVRFRKLLLENTKLDAYRARTMIRRMDDREVGDGGIELLTEMNPACSDHNFTPSSLTETSFDIIDLVPADFRDRAIDGLCFDYPHAWSVVDAFAKWNDEEHPSYTPYTLQVIKYQHGNWGAPRTMHEYLENIIHLPIKTVHMTDETHLTHGNLPPLPEPEKKGEINFNEAIAQLKEFVPKSGTTGIVPMTLEIAAAHTPEGFEFFKKSQKYLQGIIDEA